MDIEPSCWFGSLTSSFGLSYAGLQNTALGMELKKGFDVVVTASKTTQGEINKVVTGKGRGTSLAPASSAADGKALPGLHVVLQAGDPASKTVAAENR